ncbi:hypothetical protein [Candidatus Uabimicrobium sp. HlEnr_7]|uniref:hypothetical protein n=1 Tax=Candidatus Uabimicrobium helgolandensis TaxID=3095367 RepID=UPI0035563BC2
MNKKNDIICFGVLFLIIILVWFMVNFSTPEEAKNLIDEKTIKEMAIDFVNNGLTKSNVKFTIMHLNIEPPQETQNTTSLINHYLQIIKYTKSRGQLHNFLESLDSQGIVFVKRNGWLEVGDENFSQQKIASLAADLTKGWVSKNTVDFTLYSLGIDIKQQDKQKYFVKILQFLNKKRMIKQWLIKLSDDEIIIAKEWLKKLNTAN